MTDYRKQFEEETGNIYPPHTNKFITSDDMHEWFENYNEWLKEKLDKKMPSYEDVMTYVYDNGKCPRVKDVYNTIKKLMQ